MIRRFYPTYEALKLYSFSSFFQTFLWRFYPTYEALKQSLKDVNDHAKKLFLPYLWGIETFFAFE